MHSVTTILFKPIIILKSKQVEEKNQATLSHTKSISVYQLVDMGKFFKEFSS